MLGWCDDESFTKPPLIVAFNAAAVAGRVNAKLERRGATASESVRGSDSQQFRQALLDQAQVSGVAVGQNQHGEFVVAMKPERFAEYLSAYMPQYHSGIGAAPAFAATPSMQGLVAEAEVEVAAPSDDDPN